MSEYAEFIDVDDESMTWDGYQYAQVGQCHNLGDEVRDLRKKVQELTRKTEDFRKQVRGLERKAQIQQNTIEYWRGCYADLATVAAGVMGLYGWAEGTDYRDGLDRVRNDILALRARVRELKQGNK